MSQGSPWVYKIFFLLGPWVRPPKPYSQTWVETDLPFLLSSSSETLLLDKQLNLTLLQPLVARSRILYRPGNDDDDNEEEIKRVMTTRRP